MARAVEDQTGLHPWPLLEEKDEKRGNSWCGRAPGEDSSLSPLFANIPTGNWLQDLAVPPALEQLCSSAALGIS